MSEQGFLDILSGMDVNPALGVGKPVNATRGGGIFPYRYCRKGSLLSRVASSGFQTNSAALVHPNTLSAVWPQTR
jgi:hypothetical protein